MRRVASNWVYRSETQLLKQAVVVLTDEYVGNYYAIQDDMPATEWIGGIVFLTAQEEPEFPKMVTLEDLKRLLLDEEYTPRYAYHLEGIDIDSTELFPSARVVRLEGEWD